MSFACPSFRSTPLAISQQSFAPGVSHIFGALSVLKMRHAFMLLPSKSDFHAPAFGAAGWTNKAVSRKAIVGIMRVGIPRGGLVSDVRPWRIDKFRDVAWFERPLQLPLH